MFAVKLITLLVVAVATVNGSGFSGAPLAYPAPATIGYQQSIPYNVYPWAARTDIFNRGLFAPVAPAIASIAPIAPVAHVAAAIAPVPAPVAPVFRSFGPALSNSVVSSYSVTGPVGFAAHAPIVRAAPYLRSAINPYAAYASPFIGAPAPILRSPVDFSGHPW